MKATRTDVYDALDTERDYQQKKFGGDAPRSVGDFLVYMQDYLTEAVRQATRDPSSQESNTVSYATLETVRKITAIGVACMEQHGAPQRASYVFPTGGQ
jgi:hypothetical protein